MVKRRHHISSIPNAFEDDRHKKGNWNRYNQVVPGLQISVICEEGKIAECPEEKSGNQRIAEQPPIEQQNDTYGKEGRGIEKMAHPQAIRKRLPNDRDRVGNSDAGVS